MADPWVGTIEPGSSVKHKALYKVWAEMLRRCYNPVDGSFPDYGGRGIGVADRWRYGEDGVPGLQCFMLDMGDRPDGWTIEREDNDLGYGPTNCRWASRAEQAENKRNLVYLTIGGTRKTFAAWSRSAGIPYFTLRQRMARGDVGERLLRPVRPLKKRALL